MPCPDENVLAALARDELPAAERATIEAHIDACDACSEVVAELMRLFASSFSAGEQPQAVQELSTSGVESTLGGMELPPNDAWPTELPLPEGAKLGRYVVLRAIGAGAMGIVYAAYDPELDRKIALKLLRRGTADDADDAASQQSSRDKRLLREAQALARLTHPHVITVHDVGTWEGGRVFLAMEFVEGGTLTRWLEAGPRPWREVLRVLLQAGEGLAAAHEAGLVHRDFKPDNVLLRADGRAVVTDFGLARPLGRTPDEETTSAASTSTSQRASASASALIETLTRTGALIGTPAYMAPEQLDGRRCDAQSDQFGFCVALYEGLYGERPFQGRTLSGLMTAVYAGHVRPPPRGREVPRWLRRAVVRGLRVQPQERHPDMRALLAALRPSRLGWRGVVAMGALSAAAGAAAVAVSASPAPDPAAYCDDVATKLEGVWDEPARAELRAAFAGTGLPLADDTATQAIARFDERATQWTDAQSEVCRREVEGREPTAVVDVRMTCLARRHGSLSAMAAALRHADADAVMQAVDAVDGLPGALECLDAGALSRSLAPVPEAEREAVAAVRALLAEAAALQTLGKATASHARAEEAAVVAEGLGYGPLAAEVAMGLATGLEATGELAKAEGALYRALIAGVAHDHDEVVAEAALGLANVEFEHLGRPEAIERWASLGLAALESLGGAWPHLQVGLMSMRGEAQRTANDLKGAIATLREVVALCEQHRGPEHFAVAEPLGSLGLAHAYSGQHEEGVRQLERAREILRKTYGDQHPNHGIALQNLGSAYYVSGRYREALAFYQEALRLFEAGLGSRHPHVGVVAYNVASTLAALEHHDEALASLRTAQRIENEVHGARSRSSAMSLGLLGEIHMHAGALPLAEAALRQALAIQDEIAPDDRQGHAAYESLLGHALALVGRVPEADALLGAALAVQRELGESSLPVADTAGRLAMVRLAQGRLSEARTLIDASARRYESEALDPHPRAEAWFRRAQVLAAQGERAAATAEAERARRLYAELSDQPGRQRAVEQWLAQP
jgi:tetratricopeptide (TPR) repeat protein/tRNA A-37 threonylcarbamoyl transferase component Bud32